MIEQHVPPTSAFLPHSSAKNISKKDIVISFFFFFSLSCSVIVVKKKRSAVFTSCSRPLYFFVLGPGVVFVLLVQTYESRQWGETHRCVLSAHITTPVYRNLSVTFSLGEDLYPQ